MTYTPDYWLMLKINALEPGVSYHYKIFGTWISSYLGGASWKLNSGITSVSEADLYYDFAGHSGSVYRCAKRCYNTTGYGQSVLDSLTAQAQSVGATIEVVAEDQLLQVIRELTG